MPLIDSDEPVEAPLEAHVCAIQLVVLALIKTHPDPAAAATALRQSMALLQADSALSTQAYIHPAIPALLRPFLNSLDIASGEREQGR